MKPFPFTFRMLWTVVLFSGVALYPGRGMAQTTFGRILGTVRDASGAAIPGAQIQITNQGTNVSRAVTTDTSGNYEATHLNSGHYVVAVESQGFKRFVRPDVPLEALGTVRVDATLAVGELAAEVTVTSTIPVVETETPVIAQTRSRREIMELPLNLISIATGSALTYELTRLTPTSFQGGGSRRAMGGGRGSSSSFNVDGISANSPAFGNQIAVLSPNAEVVEEVRFEYVGSKAEFGEVANVTAITRSGGNKLHGSSFWYHDNTALGARNTFQQTKGPLDPNTGEELNTANNSFGGSLSGPLKRDKLFFFGAYEHGRNRTPQVVNYNVPTLKMRQGDFSELLALARPIPIRDPLSGQNFAGNIIPGNRLYQGSVAMQDRFFPSPNFGPPESFATNFRSSFDNLRPSNRVDSRADYYVSPRNTLWGRFSYFWNFPAGLDVVNASGQPQFGSARRSGTQFAFSESWTISPRLINELKLGYSQNHNRNAGSMDGRELVDLLGIQGLPDVPSTPWRPNVQITGFTTLGEGNAADQVEESFQVMDQLSWIRGRHSLKTGIEYRPQRYKGPRWFRPGVYTFTPRFTGFAYSDFLLGIPESTLRRAQRDTWYARFWFLNGFVQDDIKVSPKLTLNLGLRWEYNSPVWDKYDILSNFDPQTGSLVVPTEAALRKVPANFPRQVPVIIATQAGFPARTLRQNDTNNFAPRFGFAYRPLADTTTVVRGSYGIYYDDLTADFAGAFFVSAGPFDFQENFVNQITSGVPALTLQRPFLQVGSLGALNVQGAAQNIRNPYMQQWSLTLERDIGFQTALRIAYIGVKTNQIIYRRNINQPPAGAIPFSPARRPYPLYQNVTFAENGGNQMYNALSVQAERRFAGGLYFQTNWTLTKSLTDADEDGGVEGGPTLENSYDRARDRADARFAPRHRFIANAIWDLPVGRGRRFLNRPGLANHVLGGWELTTTFITQTGEYLTPTFAGADPSNTNTLGGRPDRLRDGNLPDGESSITRWFDASAFAPPPNGRFGNSARSVILGPGRVVLNLGVWKNFAITEASSLRFLITATNALNHPNYAIPALNISAPGAVGRVTSLVTDRDFAGPRRMMIGLRYEF
ncbi:MAG: carboxypeptidase regulatory-like domain-containing protein [Bryobacteraceae bacterium]